MQDELIGQCPRCGGSLTINHRCPFEAVPELNTDALKASGIMPLRHYTPLTFQQFADTNALRCIRWHDGSQAPWLSVDWSNELAGETGEACNIVKKIRRIDTGVKSRKPMEREDLVVKLSKEIGDVVICAQLLADHFNLNLEACVKYAFNMTSEKEGFPERL